MPADQFVDFADVKSRVNAEKAAALLNLQTKRQGQQLRGPCPACKSGGDRALAVNLAKSVFYCFAEGKGGDVIALAAHVKGISARDAAIFLGGGTSPVTGVNNSPAPMPAPEGFAPLDYLEPAHEAVEALGLDADTAQILGIGFCGRGTMRGLIAIPLRTPEGVLVGYAGVTEARFPSKFHFPEQKVVPFSKKAG